MRCLILLIELNFVMVLASAAIVLIILSKSTVYCIGQPSIFDFFFNSKHCDEMNR